ncbi:MAG: glycosyltransferase, partial [Spirochaetota bacterium]|nr:glycosyltransferase [Spirochaetota bacterium]
MNDIKISVITVCYNSEKTIEETLKSIYAQSYPNIEHVIIDGQSTDRTVDIIKKYKDQYQYFVSEKDNGIYHAMNKGIEASSGDILFFLNSDDYFPDEKVVEDVVNKFVENPELDAVYGNQSFYDNKGLKLMR